MLVSQTSVTEEGRCGTDANRRDEDEDCCSACSSWSPVCAAAIASKSTTLGGGTWKPLQEGGVGFLVRECLIDEVEFVSKVRYE